MLHQVLHILQGSLGLAFSFLIVGRAIAGFLQRKVLRMTVRGVCLLVPAVLLNVVVLVSVMLLSVVRVVSDVVHKHAVLVALLVSLVGELLVLLAPVVLLIVVVLVSVVLLSLVLLVSDVLLRVVVLGALLVSLDADGSFEHSQPSAPTRPPRR